jgi:hypothetical protein
MNKNKNNGYVTKGHRHSSNGTRDSNLNSQLLTCFGLIVVLTALMMVVSMLGLGSSDAHVKSQLEKNTAKAKAFLEERVMGDAGWGGTVEVEVWGPDDVEEVVTMREKRIGMTVGDAEMTKRWEEWEKLFVESKVFEGVVDLENKKGELLLNRTISSGGPSSSSPPSNESANQNKVKRQLARDSLSAGKNKVVVPRNRNTNLQTKKKASKQPSPSPPDEVAKYFHEHPSNPHLDFRFGNNSSKYPTDEAKNMVLKELLKAWDTFTTERKVWSWLAHGTLLGWFWGGWVLPWDLDVVRILSYVKLTSWRLTVCRWCQPNPSLLACIIYLDCCHNKVNLINSLTKFQ